MGISEQVMQFQGNKRVNMLNFLRACKRDFFISITIGYDFKVWILLKGFRCSRTVSRNKRYRNTILSILPISASQYLAHEIIIINIDVP